MDRQLTGRVEAPLSETPEDVAILYSWANLHGAKYRDFSASRREYRAQVRHRAAEEIRRAELQAKIEAEAMAAEAERVAREAERVAQAPDSEIGRLEREQALRAADEAARVAAVERQEAARRAEAAALAQAASRREEREIAAAHLSAERQASTWNESEMRRRQLAGPQPVPAESEGDPYQYSARSFDPADDAPLASPNRALAYTQPDRFRDETVEFAPRTSGERRAYREKLEVHRRPQGYRPDLESGMRAAYPLGAIRAEIAEIAAQESRAQQARSEGISSEGISSAAIRAQGIAAQGFGVTEPGGAGGWQRPVLQAPRHESGIRPASSAPHAPAWLSGEAALRTVPRLGQPGGTNGATDPASGSLANTLQYSRERVAARWFALKGLFEPGQQPPAMTATEPRIESQAPMLAIYSLAGGAGKTSLLASLGRSLCANGEKVLLADTTPHGLLPYYFGASELKTGVVRTFSPPAGSVDAPIHLVSYAVDTCADGPAQETLAAALLRNAAGADRLVLDLELNAPWLIERTTRLRAAALPSESYAAPGVHPEILVPLLPNMNSVINLRWLEHRLHSLNDSDTGGFVPRYVLNQFDSTQPLHLDVREVLRRQLGDRLLPITIRSSPLVAEALAEGMTVIDYAPGSAIAGDYRALADWLRSVSAPRTQVARSSRWSEQ